MPLLEAKQLSKRYGDVDALAGLNLAIAPGEVFCLLGANGAGKTTALNLFLGFLAPTLGQALVAGRIVHEDPAAARKLLGYLPEVVQLYPTLTGLETLTYFNDLAQRPKLTPEAAGEILAQAGIAESAHDRRVSDYSKGMRQKLGLAIALSKGARALLLDEPLSGLDPKAANELVSLVRQLAGNGSAILAVTHDIFRAQQMADYVGIMRQGHLVETVDPRSMSAKEIEDLYVHHLRDVA